MEIKEITKALYEYTMEHQTPAAIGVITINGKEADDE